MRIFLNGKEADTGLDTRPITRADYDALSSSDKNLDVLYLVDNSPQQDFEGSSGESYSRYVLYYHGLSLTSGSITDYVSKTEFDETIGEISTLLDIILGEGDVE